MELRKGDRWHCLNQACRSEILVLASSDAWDGTNPRCSCGAIMKKPYAPPVLKTFPAAKEA